MKRLPSTTTWLSPPPPSDCSSMRTRPSCEAHSRPLAPVSSVSAPSPRLELSMRWLVKLIRALTPSTAGAVSASWIACASGLGGGTGPPAVAAIAIAAAPTAAATTEAQSASRRRVEMRRRKRIGVPRRVRPDAKDFLTVGRRRSGAPAVFVVALERSPEDDLGLLVDADVLHERL